MVLGLVVGATTANTQGNEPILHDQIDSYLKNLIESGLSGAVLVARNRGIILHEGYGLTNDEDGQPITPDAVFHFGSITKQFTAAAILHIEMQGLLNAGDRNSEYLDDVPADKADVTIHQLLTHSSGLPNHVLQDDFSEIARDDASRQILASDLLVEPGIRVGYSDNAFKLLATIVEIVLGQSWQSYMETNLFAPAGMDNTGFFNKSNGRSEALQTITGMAGTWGHHVIGPAFIER